jgi:hypothetical protein
MQLLGIFAVCMRLGVYPYLPSPERLDAVSVDSIIPWKHNLNTIFNLRLMMLSCKENH